MLRTKRGRPSWVPSPLGREMCPRTNLQCGPRGGGPVVKGTQRTDNGQVSRLGQPQLGLGLRLHFTGGGHPQTASISPVPALDSWTKPGHTDPPLQAWGGPSPGTASCPRACSTHREGSLGDLHAVVRDAPTEAARDASAVLLLLAAHHGLHGVATHTDGPLWGEVTGT